MEKRQLGKSGLQVSRLCFGGNVFGWTADEPTSFALLDAFVEAGGNFIDTADAYSRWVPGHQGGESETIIGNWLKRRGRRDDVVIATKVGSDMGSGRNISKDYVRKAAEDSLRRLQTDRIDLYQTHWDVAGMPVEETLEAYDELIRAGKVRVVGASNFSAARLREALDASARLGLPRYESLQPEYNLYSRAGFETELDPVCREHGLGVIPFYALAAGFLTGKYRSEADFGKSPRGQGMAKYLDDRGRRILGALDQVAERHGGKPAEVAVAWLIARPAVTAAIASATSLEQLGSLVAAARLKLDPDDIARLDEASA